MTPTIGLVVYENNRDKALETWSIRNGRFCDPRGLTEKDAEKLVNSIESAYKLQSGAWRGLIPDNLVYISKDRLLFRLDAGNRTILIDGKDDENKTSEMNLWVPPMLMDYKGPSHSLSIHWEVTVNKKVAYIPALMPNTDRRGSVCLGSSMTRAKFSRDIPLMMDTVVRHFFKSSFNEWRSDETVMAIQRLREIHDRKRSQAKLWSGKLAKVLKKAVPLTTVIHEGMS